MLDELSSGTSLLDILLLLVLAFWAAFSLMCVTEISRRRTRRAGREYEKVRRDLSRSM
jgi:hypothetical protein